MVTKHTHHFRVEVTTTLIGDFDWYAFVAIMQRKAEEAFNDDNHKTIVSLKEVFPTFYFFLGAGWGALMGIIAMDLLA